MRAKVLYHDHCFDGVASAAIFARFYKSAINAEAEVLFEGLAYRAGQTFGEDIFSGDENIIVDFKYSSSDKLTWWFDHHESAFLTPEDEQHFRRDRSGKKFHDTSFRSCAKLIATVADQRFGFRAAELEELIEWADIVDGARFPDAASAVMLEAPAMRLMLVIESSRHGEVVERLLRDLQEKPLGQVAAENYVRQAFEWLYQQHLETIEIIKNASRYEDGVVYFDITGYNIENYNKFIPYYLYPEATYSVGLSWSPVRTKISVGSNPWARRGRTHNLAKLCERYGGGGHPVVAAISFGPDELERARAVAREIMAELGDKQQ